MIVARALALACVALASAMPGVSAGCGVCLEDKVAATYDHGVVERARQRGHVMVFVEVNGDAKSEDLVRDVRRKVLELRGIDRGSVRVSDFPATVSFALDPQVRSPVEVVATLEKSARGRFRIELLKTI